MGRELLTFGRNDGHLRKINSSMPIAGFYHGIEFAPIGLDGRRNMLRSIVVFPTKNLDHDRFAMLFSAKQKVRLRKYQATREERPNTPASAGEKPAVGPALRGT
jgi:hypothetical protein